MGRKKEDSIEVTGMISHISLVMRRIVADHSIHVVQDVGSYAN